VKSNFRGDSLMLQTKGEILIIDDDPLVRMNYADILEDEGYTVSDASSFAQGRNIATARDFDLVICDHDLGDGKGIDLLKGLIEKGKDMPVIYLSGALPSVLEEVAKLPIVRKVLAKPVSEDVIIDTVEEFLSVSDVDKYPRLIGDDERDELLNNFMINDEEL